MTTSQHKDPVPLAALDQHLGIFGSTGSGKSYTARFLLELLLAAAETSGTPAVIIDPKGDWWGVRLSRDGKKPAHPFIIVGGPHADEGLQLPENSPEDLAEPLARMVCGSSTKLIIDLSELGPEAMRRFVGAFVQAVYHHNRSPLFLITDEADEFAPQNAKGMATHCLSAMARMAKRGRGRGVRFWTISQRPASINTDVRGQMQAVCAMKLTLPHDIKAVREWMQTFDPKRADELARSFPTLRGGKQALREGRGAQGWFWSPEHGDPNLVEWPKIETFDSMRTPEHGEDRSGVVPAAIDTQVLRTFLADHVRELEENDPKRLRNRIAELEERLAAAGTPADAQPCQECQRLQSIVEAKQVRAVELINEITGAAAHMETVGKNLVRFAGEMVGGTDAQALDIEDNGYEFITGKPAPWASGKEESHDQTDSNQDLRRMRNHQDDRRGQGGGHGGMELPASQDGAGRVRTDRMEHASETGGRRPSPVLQSLPNVLGKGETAVLTAAAQHRSGVTREQLTILTGYKRSSRDTYLQRLKASGYVRDTGGMIEATAEGVAALGPSFKPLPTGSRLRAHWLERLPEGERKILKVLVDAKRPISRAEIDKHTDYKRSSRDTYLQRLIARRLVENIAAGLVTASRHLFDRSEGGVG